MEYRKFNHKILSSILTVLAIVITINYLVNPFNIFKQRIFKNSLLKPEATIQERLTKPISLKIDKRQIDTVFIGTSRADLALNVNDYEKLTHKTARNVALKGLIYEEIEPMLNITLATHPEIKNIYIATDFHTFSKHDKDENNNRMQITKNPKLEFGELSTALLSINTTSNSIWAIVKNIIGVERRMHYKEGHQHIYVNEKIKEEFDRSSSEYDGKYKNYELDYEKIKAFKRYVKKLREEGKNVKLFIMPTHITIQNKIDETGKRKIYHQWLSEMTTLDDVYDFNIKNEYTTEEIKPDMQYFFEGSHSTHKFGEIVIKDLLSDEPKYAVIHKKQKYSKGVTNVI